MNILIVGDVYSKLGRESLEENLKKIKSEKTIHFLIVNGENISHGKGINENHYKWLMQLGVNVVTLGNHSYQNKQIFNYIDNVNNLVRPYNYPLDSPGKGYTTINYNGTLITVFQMIGTVFMDENNLKVIFIFVIFMVKQQVKKLLLVIILMVEFKLFLVPILM